MRRGEIHERAGTFYYSESDPIQVGSMHSDEVLNLNALGIIKL